MLLTCYNVAFQLYGSYLFIFINIILFLPYFYPKLMIDIYIQKCKLLSILVEWDYCSNNQTYLSEYQIRWLNILMGFISSDNCRMIRWCDHQCDPASWITSGSPVHPGRESFEFIDASKPTKCLILVPFCSQIAVKLNKSISQIESNQNHRANPITLCLFALFFQMISSSFVLRISRLPFIWCHVYREVVDYLLGHSSVFTALG